MLKKIIEILQPENYLYLIVATIFLVLALALMFLDEDPIVKYFCLTNVFVCTSAHAILNQLKRR